HSSRASAGRATRGLEQPQEYFANQLNPPPNGRIILLYDVTVKKIDLKRLDDCILAQESVNVSDVPLAFICRLPDDISELPNVRKNTLLYKGKAIEFADIMKFVSSAFTLISDEKVEAIFCSLRTFVADVNTSIKAKNAWNGIFAET
ncbi:MAG: hypothetical protein ACKN9T_16285, partial [Candidatus Methylumidiphilus sp.]